MDHMHHVEEIALWKQVSGLGFLLLIIHSMRAADLFIQPEELKVHWHLHG